MDGGGGDSDSRLQAARAYGRKVMMWQQKVVKPLHQQTSILAIVSHSEL